jgi:hypothetical protein
MSLQAQIKEWADSALHAVLDPLFERVEKIEAYIKAFEQMDVIPDDPAPRGKGPEATAAARSATAAAKQAPSGPVRTGRPTGSK